MFVAPKEFKAQRVHKGFKEFKEFKAKLVFKGFKALLVLQERKAPLVQRVQQVRLGLLEQTVLQGSKAPQDHRDQRERRENKGFKEIQVRWDQQGQQE